MAQVELAGKAETLERLRPHLRSAAVLPQVCFFVADWQQDKCAVLASIQAQDWSKSGPMIVRSSAALEDGHDNSMAGHFVSVPDVCLTGISAAIDRVIGSFASAQSDENKFFVQPMVRAQLSGVVFTSDPNTGAPYMVVNYFEDEDTAAVTAGKAVDLRTFVYWRHALVECPEPFDRLSRLADELEVLFDQDSLDFEFAIDQDGQLILLQVRALVAGRDSSISTEDHRQLLESIAEKIESANRPHPYLRGRRTLYGVMPDWNPAEVIGLRPRPLALSLYRELITDSIWAYQRHNYGYRNLRSFPLMASFRGLPYIDVRLSFNSFIPNDLSDSLADRLVDCYIDQLAEAPVLHDKVEFEIVYSCYTFDLPDRLARLSHRGFTERECTDIAEALRHLTNRIIHRDSGLWRIDSAKIEQLTELQHTLRASDMHLIGRLYWLMEDCKRYGTLPFAGLARAGFVAIQMLRSLVNVGALTAAQYDAYLANLETVSGRMKHDLRRLTRVEFLAEYGHLRPGTYDITSYRYDEDPDRYLGDHENAGKEDEERPEFSLSLDQMRHIDQLLRQHELDVDVVGLFEFLEAGIKGREHAKFVFTRSLSDALSLLTELGAQHGIDRDAMSYFDARLISDLHASSLDVGATLRHSIEQGRERYEETKRIFLPPVISKREDVWAFHIPPTEPNFITQCSAIGPVKSADVSPETLSGAIVTIPSADPGYDWLFSRNIAGLITAYGGANSHMAIRAGELNLPAVIGAGETLYESWSAATQLRIDCATRRVEILF